MRRTSFAFPRSAKGPAILFGVALALIVALTALWNVVLSRDYLRMHELATRAAAEEGGAFHWTFIALGSSLFVTIIVLLSILGVELFGEIRMNQLQSAFIATVTHELNSPLASIKLHAQTLRKPDLSPEERARFLETLLADVERLRGLIANVLRSAEVEAGSIGLATERVRLRAYLAEYAAEVGGALARRGNGGELRLAPDGPDAEVDIDRPVFRQVLDNLIDNSLKCARGDRARIEIATAPAPPSLRLRTGKRIAIEVRDDGIGIPKAELGRIFERFRRVTEGSAGRPRPGTGLGLSIARALTRLHGGTIVALSEGPEKGATIRIELPVARGTAE